MSKIIIFGDIHGCSKAALKAIEFSESNCLKAIFLGDYIDRGYDSINTLFHLIEAKKRNPNWIFLSGNHESMLIDIINNTKLINENSNLISGENFSYYETSRTYYQLINSSSISLSTVNTFLNQLTNYYETKNFICVHAVLNDDKVNLNLKSRESLLWNYNTLPEWTLKNYIHGHDRVNFVQTHGKGININTSCGFGGYLTGVIIDSTYFKILDFIKISENGDLL